MSFDLGYEDCDRVNIGADSIPACDGGFDQHCAASAERVEYMISRLRVFVNQLPDDRRMELSWEPEEVMCQPIEIPLV